MADRAFYLFDHENLAESAKSFSASWDSVLFAGCKLQENKLL